MRVYQKNNKIYVDYTTNGKRYRRSLNLTYNKPNLAYVQRNILPQLEKELEMGLEQREYLLSEFCESVLEWTKLNKKPHTYIIYKLSMKAFFKYCEDKDVRKYSTREIEDIILRMSSTLCANTIKVYMNIINLAFKEALRQDIISKSPVTYAKKPIAKAKKRKPYNIFQVKRILNEASGELKTFLYIAFYTGARAGEILALTRDDITEDRIVINKTLTLCGTNSTKNGKSRKVFLLEPLKKYLSSLQSFPIKAHYRTLRLGFRELCKTLELPYTGLHTTRHTFTSLLVQAGTNPTLIQHMLGHSDLDMINKIYAHYLEDENDKSELEKVLNF